MPAETGSPSTPPRADATDCEAAHDALRRVAHADAVEAEVADLPAAEDLHAGVAVVCDALATRGVGARDRVAGEVDGDAVGTDDERGAGAVQDVRGERSALRQRRAAADRGRARAGAARAEAETRAGREREQVNACDGAHDRSLS